MLTFEKIVRVIDSNDGELVTFNKVPITGYVDDLVKVVQHLSSFVGSTSGRSIQQSEWEAIFHQVLLRAKV